MSDPSTVSNVWDHLLYYYIHIYIYIYIFPSRVLDSYNVWGFLLDVSHLVFQFPASEVSRIRHWLSGSKCHHLADFSGETWVLQSRYLREGGGQWYHHLFFYTESPRTTRSFRETFFFWIFVSFPNLSHGSVMLRKSNTLQRVPRTTYAKAAYIGQYSKYSQGIYWGTWVPSQSVAFQHTMWCTKSRKLLNHHFGSNSKSNLLTNSNLRDQSSSEQLAICKIQQSSIFHHPGYPGLFKIGFPQGPFLGKHVLP